RYFRQFDRNQTETLTGEVVNLATYSSRRENFSGVHLMVNTEQETIEVHIGPSWYLAEQDFEFSSQDQIVVKGSRINIDGQPAIIAREIKKGDRVLILRDVNGLPVWRASNR
ncbi:MAG: DNA-binding protein, partial [Cyanobacteria bacterium P01_A01_bin.40]